MKITAFYPTIATNNTEKVIKDMEKFGFHIIYRRFDLFEKGDSEYVLETETGQRVDVISCPEIEENFYAIRVNMDDFDEATMIGKITSRMPSTHLTENICHSTAGRKKLLHR